MGLLVRLFGVGFLNFEGFVEIRLYNEVEIGLF